MQDDKEARQNANAYMKEAPNDYLNEALFTLSQRYGHERVEIGLRTVAIINPAESVRPFDRGILSAAEFAEDEEETPRIWFGIYPGALTYICGETGAGKSSLLYNIFIHAARNEPLWGIPFGLKRPITTLYIDPENAGNFDKGRAGLCSRKLRRIGQGQPEALLFHDGQGVNLTRPECFADLERIIEERKLDVVCLDPIINLFGTKDENDNAEAAAQFTMLKSLCKRTNVALVNVHHTGRDQTSIFGRGATARLGVADVGLMLRVRGETEETDDDYGAGELHDRTDHVRLQMIKNRLEPGKASLFFQMAGEDRFERVKFADWKAARVASEPKPTKKDKAEEDVFCFLAGGQWHGTDDLVEAMRKEGIGKNVVYSALRALFDDGIVEKKVGAHNKTEFRVLPVTNPNSSFPVSQSPLEKLGNWETGIVDKETGFRMPYKEDDDDPIT
jgi:hypothetical protein